MTEPTPIATLFYDSDCGFCVWCTAKVMALDRRRQLRYRPIQDPASAALLRPVPEDRRLDSWHLVTAGGRVHSGGRAFVPLLRRLPAGRPAAAILRWIPPTLLDRAYYVVAKRRAGAGRFLTEGARRRSRARVARHVA